MPLCTVQVIPGFSIVAAGRDREGRQDGAEGRDSTARLLQPHAAFPADFPAPLTDSLLTLVQLVWLAAALCWALLLSTARVT
jgi:hypothetical protein